MTAKKIDSNVTGLAIAYETSIGVLPDTPIWYPLEPNSYADFGANIKTTPRNPINQSRQTKKGFVTDLDANGGFNQDLTQTNLTRHLQAFFFANMREKLSTAPLNGAKITITGVDSVTGYAAVSGLAGFTANTLVKASGFGVAANNGLKMVVSSTGTAVVMSAQATEASPPTDAKLERVGRQFASGDISFTVNGSLSRMNSAAVDLTTLGLIPGEWIFVGGDNVANQFAVNRGWARCSVITDDYIEFDKTDWTATAETGVGKTLHVFFGNVLRTEEDPANQVRRTGTLERRMGDAGTGEQAEYISGATANTLTLNMPQSDKITADLGYVALDGSQNTGTVGLKTGTRVVEASTDAFNTSSDFSRIKMAVVDPTNSNVTPLFAYLLEFTLNISNNVTSTKALGTLGGFDTNAGQFTADGKLTAYLADISSVSAVRNNTDVTIDIIMAKNNAAMVFDLPLISLGGGMSKVEKDKPIQVPIDAMAAQSNFGHTLLYQNFPYVPNLAQ